MLASIRSRVDDFVSKIETLKEVDFDKSLEKMFDRLHLPHYEEPLFERLALGYALLKKFDTHLVVENDIELARLCEQAHAWRREIKRGASESQVMIILREKPMFTLKELYDRMTNFGLSLTETSAILDTLRKQGRIHLSRLSIPGKKTETVVSIRE